MRQAFIILIISLTIVNICKGQLALNPYHWDQSLSYNPSTVGVLTDEGVQISIISNNRINASENFFSSSSTGLTTRTFNEPSIQTIKNLYYFSYQKTHTLRSNKRLTIGLQLQKAENASHQIHNLSTFSLATNLHIPRSHNEYKEKYWSFGIQMNLLFRNPNKTTLDIIRTEYVDLGFKVNANDFESQFRDIGLQNTVGINYTVHKFNKSLFNFGINLINLQYKITQSNFRSPPSFSFITAVKNTLRAVLDKQFVINNKLMLELKAQLRFRINLQHTTPRELSLGAGLGFQLPKDNILRLAVLIGGDSGPGAINTFGVNIDRKQFSYNFTLTQYLLQFISPERNFAQIFQIGVNYKFNIIDSPSLLRINN